MSTADFAQPTRSDSGSFSAAQRALLGVASVAILAPQVLRIQSAFSFFQQGHYDSFSGAAFAIVSSIVFALQLFRGRWLIGACFFLAFLLAGALFVILSAPAQIGDLPFRRFVIMRQVPFIASSVAGLCLILYVRCLSNRNDRDA